jgi:cobalt-zinc-cadmium efflux system outer membrane protein
MPQIYAKQHPNRLTLSELLQKVEAQNPELQAKKVAIQTNKAKERQAKVMPNPELELESENIYGSGDTQGLDSAETTLRFSEKLEWGGKRSSRIKAAQLQTQASKLEFEIDKQRLFLTAFERYVAVISEGQRLSIAKDQQTIHKKFVETVKKQVQSGRLPQAEQARTEVQLLQSTFEIEKVEHEYTKGLSKLGILYNETELIRPFNVEPLPIPSGNLTELETYAKNFLSQNKSYQLLLLSREQATHQISVEKSLGSQDLVLSAGVKKENGSDTTSFVAGIGIPLTLFDQNKGNIESASFKAKEWDSIIQAEKNNILVTYEHTFHHAHLLQKETDLLINNVIPKTKSIYDQVNTGYLQGKYTYLDVLNARQDWITAQETLVEVLGNYWKTVAKLEVISGHSLDHQLPQLFAQTKEATHD